jgi:hypothetical protein
MIVSGSEPSDETHVSLAASLPDIEAGAVVAILAMHRSVGTSGWTANG